MLIDKGTNLGDPILHALNSSTPDFSLARTARLYSDAQCKMLIQTVNWYDDGRTSMDESGHTRFVPGNTERRIAPNLLLPAIRLSYRI